MEKTGVPRCSGHDFLVVAITVVGDFLEIVPEDDSKKQRDQAAENAQRTSDESQKNQRCVALVHEDLSKSIRIGRFELVLERGSGGTSYRMNPPRF